MRPPEEPAAPPPPDGQNTSPMTVPQAELLAHTLCMVLLTGDTRKDVSSLLAYSEEQAFSSLLWRTDRDVRDHGRALGYKLVEALSEAGFTIKMPAEKPVLKALKVIMTKPEELAYELTEVR